MGKITLGVICLILLNVYSYSRWWCNYSDNAFDGKITIKDCIASGAEFFLDSYSNTLLFMKKTESSSFEDLNYEELGTILDRALSSMNLANEAYVELKQAADHTPYNPVVINALRNYNYDNFRESTPVNDAVFTEVKMYLLNGDIRGVYGKILADTDNIVNLLKKVKSSVDEGKFPSLNDVWNLNQAFFNTLLFGGYVAKVFHEL